MIPITNTRQRSVPDEIIDLLEDGQVLKNGNIIHQKGSIGTRDGQNIEVAGFPDFFSDFFRASKKVS